MLEKFKANLTQLTILLCLYSGLAALIAFVFDFQPSMRLNSSTVLRVLPGAFLGLALISALYIIFIFCCPKSWHKRCLDSLALIRNKDPLTAIGAAAVAGLGEELLLRGFIFAALLQVNTTLALICNFALAFALAANRRKEFITPTVSAFAASYYAVIYLNTRSLFLCAAIRYFVELGLYLLVRWPKAYSFISEQLPGIAWRLFSRGRKKFAH